MVVSFLGVGEIHILLNKYLSIGVVILYAIVSNYNQSMLKRELREIPTAYFYSSGKSIMIEYTLILSIYIGMIYLLINIL